MATQEEIDNILAIAEERLGERERAVKAREEALSEGGPKTLRDYMAAMALPAVVAATSAGQHNAGALRGLPDDASMETRMAADAYAMADAMLIARLK